ncbi:outer membrane biosynthesis protein TonB [Staphylococcus hominis]
MRRKRQKALLKRKLTIKKDKKTKEDKKSKEEKKSQENEDNESTQEDNSTEEQDTQETATNEQVQSQQQTQQPATQEQEQQSQQSQNTQQSSNNQSQYSDEYLANNPVSTDGDWTPEMIEENERLNKEMEANAKVAKENGYTGIPNGDVGGVPTPDKYYSNDQLDPDTGLPKEDAVPHDVE